MDDYKEVYFHEYCEKCKHWKLKDNEYPCDECLDEPINLYSHKPVRWEAVDLMVGNSNDEAGEQE